MSTNDKRKLARCVLMLTEAERRDLDTLYAWCIRTRKPIDVKKADAAKYGIAMLARMINAGELS